MEILFLKLLSHNIKNYNLLYAIKNKIQENTLNISIYFSIMTSVEEVGVKTDIQVKKKHKNIFYKINCVFLNS